MRDNSPSSPREAVLIDAAEFARLLSVSKPTIWRAREAGKLPVAIALTSQCIRWQLRTGDPATGVLDWINAGCPPLNSIEQKENQDDTVPKVEQREKLHSHGNYQRKPRIPVTGDPAVS